MKLRNKKTGEIKEWQRVGAIDYGELNEVYDSVEYNSLAELNGEWEDYKPVEPLIKDDKIRKAVRAWAEASHLVEFQIDNDEIENEWCQIDGRIEGSTDTHSISFQGIILGAMKGAKYTIEELCGEEE